MHKNHGRGIVCRCAVDDFSGVDTGTVYRAAKQLIEGDDRMAVVEE